MNKEQLKDAVIAMQDGADTANYNDELTVILALILNASDESISATYAEVRDMPDEMEDAE
jgi:hypothetical protein